MLCNTLFLIQLFRTQMLQSDSPVHVSAVECLFRKNYAWITICKTIFLTLPFLSQMLQSDSPVRFSAVEPLLHKTYPYLTNVMQHPYSQLFYSLVKCSNLTRPFVSQPWNFCFKNPMHTSPMSCKTMFLIFLFPSQMLQSDSLVRVSALKDVCLTHQCEAKPYTFFLLFPRQAHRCDAKPYS